MDKLKMRSENLVDENIEFIAKKFPNAIVEARDENGNLSKMVDFDILKQELSKEIVESDKERYQMTWPGKKQAILTANAPVAMTLRPCKEDSVDFNNTQNIYIEGDNLDVLKVLRETYLGKVKMIYIDPPYNTGNDFVYNDDFATDTEDYLERSNQVDDQGNKMSVNSESNGRFHSDWLNMIYPRLKVAKDLLTDDGVIFISIDDNEQENLKKICNEIFGESNFVSQIVWQKKTQPSFLSKKIATIKEYIIMYQKSESNLTTMGGYTDAEKLIEMINISNEKTNRVLKKENVLISNGNYSGKLAHGIYGNGELQIELLKDIIVEDGKPMDDVKLCGRFKWTQQTMDDSFKLGDIYHIKSIVSLRPTVERAIKNVGIKPILDLFSKKLNDEIPTNTDATNEIKNLFDGYAIMDYPKPVNLIKYLIRSVTYNDKNAIILDFFSGSATTAHSVMQYNFEDNGKRKYIMIQLPEKINDMSTASRNGYKNICEIGEERIRRAGDKIKKENPLTTQNLDIGFRVFKLDSSNMKDTYYEPNQYSTNLLDQLDENIKPDRTPEDLLFQVMLDLGLMLDSKIEEKTINGKKVFVVGEYNEAIDPDLICCFDSDVDNNTVTEIAKLKPRFCVFRDSSMAKDSVATNFDQIFETYSPSTTRKVL